MLIQALREVFPSGALNQAICAAIVAGAPLVLRQVAERGASAACYPEDAIGAAGRKRLAWQAVGAASAPNAPTPAMQTPSGAVRDTVEAPATTSLGTPAATAVAHEAAPAAPTSALDSGPGNPTAEHAPAMAPSPSSSILEPAGATRGAEARPIATDLEEPSSFVPTPSTEHRPQVFSGSTRDLLTLW